MHTGLQLGLYNALEVLRGRRRLRSIYTRFMSSGAGTNLKVGAQDRAVNFFVVPLHVLALQVYD